MAMNLLQVNVRETLAFFDEKPSWSEKQATAIVGILGEDLAAAVLQHCLEASGASSVKVRSETVGTGGRSGPRLDRWVEVNLPDEGTGPCSRPRSRAGRPMPSAAKPSLSERQPPRWRTYRRRHWGKYWDAELQTIPRAEIAKVLVPMRPGFDAGDRRTLPLLIFWEALGPGSRPDAQARVEGGHLFSISAPTGGFKINVPSTEPDQQGFPELWVFSVSSYLRGVTEEVMELEMPNAARRLRSLNRLVRLDDA